MKTDVYLKNRWGEQLWINIAKDVKDAILNGDANTVSHLASLTQDGLADLRYAPLCIESQKLKSGVQLAGIDFSNANLGNLILNGWTIENCIFDNAKLNTWNERSCQFKNISFRGVKFNNTAIGINSSIYENVIFSKADMRGLSFYSPQFRKCDFSYAKLTRIDFNASNFVDCKFSGEIKSVWFNKYYRFPSGEDRFGKAPFNEMKNVDFSEANLIDVMFTGGVDLSTVILPKDNSHILVRGFDAVLKKITDYSSELPPTEKEIIVKWVKAYNVHARTQSMKILNKKDILNNMGHNAGNIFIDLIEKFGH